MNPFLFRNQIGLAPPQRELVPLGEVGTLVVHHTVTPGKRPVDEWKQVQSFHMGVRRYADIAYHYGVAFDGTVLEGRDVRRRGGATYGWNAKSRAVCLIGNYEERDPSDAQVEAVAWVARGLVDKGLLAEGFDLRGHRDCVATSCPGERAYMALDRIRARMVTPSLVPSHDEMEDEVPYLMIRDDRNGAIFACFPSGKVRHIGGAEWKHYMDCNVKMVSAADDAEADRLAAHGI